MRRPLSPSEQVRKRYDRIAPVYDLIEGVMERAYFRRWRRRLWERVEGSAVLELGVGTGRNLSFYPQGVPAIALDISASMLLRARERVKRECPAVTLVCADAEKLCLPEDSFDSVVGTFVFCSIPDPVAGLAEAWRVLKPGGKLLLLEHVVSSHPLLARLMRLVNPLVVRLVGANIDRDTVDTVSRAGFRLEHVIPLTGSGLVQLIEGRKEPRPSSL